MSVILAVDGNSVLNRAYYGVKPLTNKEGFPTGALFGALNIILSAVDRFSPDGVVVSYDLRGGTFRNEMYPLYKSNRHGMPDELALQLEVSKELFSYLGWKTVEKQGYEGDDILGTVSRICEEAGDDVYILSGDRDLFQLISDKTKIALLGNSETKVYGESEFIEKYGIGVDQFIDLKSIMGDSSDCIPGIRGIGEKGAVKLIRAAGTLENLLANTRELVSQMSLVKKIESGADDAVISKKLATICTSVPIGMSENDFLFGVMKKEDLFALLSKLEFNQFLKRFRSDLQLFSPAAPEGGTDIDAAALLSFSGYFSADISENKIRLFDGNRIYSCRFDDFSEISGFFNNSVRLTVFDSKKLYHLLFSQGIRNFRFDFDAKLAGYLIDPAESKVTFGQLSKDYLGADTVESDLPALYQLTKALKDRLNNDGLSELYYSVELPLSPILADMESAGVKIEKRQIMKYSESLEMSIASVREEIYAISGESFNINSPKQLGEILFDVLGLPGKKKSTGLYPTNVEQLEKLRKYSPIIDMVLEYRKLTKLRATYCQGLLKVADENGFVHTEFGQTGTSTGRLSSSDPNLQNIPVKTENGREIRRFFVPSRSGRVFIDADYSQIELRVIAHLSGDENMIRAFREGEDIHTSAAEKIFSVGKRSVTPEMRKKAKMINFGLLYGMSEYTLSKELGIKTSDARSYMESYFRAYPEVGKYLEKSVTDAKERGYCLSMYGRRRYIPELKSTRTTLYQFGERAAKNAPIQGSAADIIKLAMINVSKELENQKLDARLILQVHDELLIEASEQDAEKAARILKNEMENAVTLSVPLTVEMKIGKSWYDCK